MFAGAAIVMGVASCGKTTVGEALAMLLGVPFVEGDKLHPPENVAKMSAGVPLDDADRWPWLDAIGARLQGDTGIIASCSALNRAYRQRLSQAAGRPVRFIYLEGSKALMAARIAARKEHFMPPSLLESQFAALEPPSNDELAQAFDVALPPEAIAKQAVDYLLGAVAHG